MKKNKVKIDGKRYYSLGEILRGNLIPGLTSIPMATRLIKSGKLQGEQVPRGLRGVQYRVLGSNIIQCLKDLNDG